MEERETVALRMNMTAIGRISSTSGPGPVGIGGPSRAGDRNNGVDISEEDQTIEEGVSGRYFKIILQLALDMTMARGAGPETFSGSRVTD